MNVAIDGHELPPIRAALSPIPGSIRGDDLSAAFAVRLSGTSRRGSIAAFGEALVSSSDAGPGIAGEQSVASGYEAAEPGGEFLGDGHDAGSFWRRSPALLLVGRDRALWLDLRCVQAWADDPGADANRPHRKEKATAAWKRTGWYREPGCVPNGSERALTRGTAGVVFAMLEQLVDGRCGACEPWLRTSLMPLSGDTGGEILVDFATGLGARQFAPTIESEVGTRTQMTNSSMVDGANSSSSAKRRRIRPCSCA
jgi:hypothetical protein